TGFAHDFPTLSTRLRFTRVTCGDLIGRPPRLGRVVTLEVDRHDSVTSSGSRWGARSRCLAL
uniref:hypothetical protein n=1 Tax=Frankia sp. Cr1 TaxID=3073931 RepID=UPI002AD5338C